MVVCVLLLENRVQVPQVNSVVGIVERRCVHAEPNLFVDVLGDVVSFFKVLFFFFHEFLESVILFFGGRVKIEVIHD